MLTVSSSQLQMSILTDKCIHQRFNLIYYSAVAFQEVESDINNINLLYIIKRKCVCIELLRKTNILCFMIV